MRDPNLERQPMTARELVLAAAAYLLLAAVVSWPLPARLATDLPAVGFGDPYIQAWQVAWGGHALTEQPADYFQANVFWPNRSSLAFSDALIGYAPSALIGEGPSAALIRYNLLFLLSYALAGWGAFVLARELGAARLGAAVAGIAFAFAPFRLDQATHLHVLSSGGIPLSLFLLHRGLRTGKPRVLLAGWALAAWQLSLGFTLGLPFAYLLAAGSIGAILVWWRSGEGPARRLAYGALAGSCAFLLWGGLQSTPYLQVANEHPQAERTRAEVSFFSPPPRSLLAAPEDNLLWGEATRGVRDDLPWPTEQSLFPGAAVTVLAALGLVTSTYRRAARVTLACGVTVTTVLALGFAGPGGGFAYEILYDVLPGWQGVRTPGRLFTFTSLGLALLAAAGISAIARGRARRAAAVALTALVLLEGGGDLTVTPAEQSPTGLARASAPVFHIPSNELNDRLYMYWSTDGFPSIANGLAVFTPDSLARLRDLSETFPDASSVSQMRSLGIRTVVFHPRLAEGTSLEDVPLRSLTDPSVTRRWVGDLLLYEIAP